MSEQHDWFDEATAAAYDEDVAQDFAKEVVGPTVDFLAHLARGGSALEFAVGTGRIALPLAARGVRVHGIELSEHMVRHLRVKPGGDAITVSIGDMATRRVEGEFDLVYLVFNTIMNLTTQAQQVACFRNAARHLRPGGAFVVEVMVPALAKLTPGEWRRAFSVSEDHIGVDEYDVVHQRIVSHHIHVDRTPPRFSLPCRYVWPSELDLMAQLADLEFDQRWEDWARAPFVASSQGHVSVWRKPASAEDGVL